MKKLVLLLLLTIVTKAGFTCSCPDYEPDFYKSITLGFSTNNCLAVFDTLILENKGGDIQKEIAHYILIDTMDVTDFEKGDTIVVTGYDGFNCKENIKGKFSKGDTMFLALAYETDSSIEKDTFGLYSCARHFLQIKNNINQQLSIPEIKDKVQSILDNKDLSTSCYSDFGDFSFLGSLSREKSNYIGIFNSYDYTYEYNGIKSQTGYFTLIGEIGGSDTPIERNVVIIGEDGINTGQLLSDFNSGDTMFLSLENGYYEEFEKDTFYLAGGICGRHYLNIENGSSEFYDFVDRERKVLTIQGIIDKINLVTDVNAKVSSNNINTFPNPAEDQIIIESNGLEIESVDIYNIRGELMKIISVDNQLIDVLSLESGEYLLQIKTEEGIDQCRFIKE